MTSTNIFRLAFLIVIVVTENVNSTENHRNPSETAKPLPLNPLRSVFDENQVKSKHSDHAENILSRVKRQYGYGYGYGYPRYRYPIPIFVGGIGYPGFGLGGFGRGFGGRGFGGRGFGGRGFGGRGFGGRGFGGIGARGIGGRGGIGGGRGGRG